MIKLAGFSIKRVFVFSFIWSCLLSVVIIFQKLKFAPQSIEQNGQLLDRYYSAFEDVAFIARSPFEYSKFLKTYYYGFNSILAFSIIHNQLTYTLFCIICLVIDVVTIKRFKKVLDEHAKMSKGDDEAKKKHAAEMKSFLMVIAFNLVNFLFRLPEILSSLVLIVGAIDPSIFYSMCILFNSCLTADQLANIFYLLSLSINLILYYFFYSTFRDCFTDCFSSLKMRLRQIFFKNVAANKM